MAKDKRQGPRRGEYCGWPSRQARLHTATKESITPRMEHAKACIDGHPQYSPRRPFLPLRTRNPQAIFLRAVPPLSEGGECSRTLHSPNIPTLSRPSSPPTIISQEPKLFPPRRPPFRKPRHPRLQHPSRRQPRSASPRDCDAPILLHVFSIGTVPRIPTSGLSFEINENTAVFASFQPSCPHEHPASRGMGFQGGSRNSVSAFLGVRLPAAPLEGRLWGNMFSIRFPSAARLGRRTLKGLFRVVQVVSFPSRAPVFFPPGVDGLGGDGVWFRALVQFRLCGKSGSPPLFCVSPGCRVLAFPRPRGWRLTG